MTPQSLGAINPAMSVPRDIPLGDKLWAGGLSGRQCQLSFDTFPGNRKVCQAVLDWMADRATPGLILTGKSGIGKTGAASLGCAVAR